MSATKSSSPAILPITTPQPLPTSDPSAITTTQPQPPPSTFSAVRNFVSSSASNARATLSSGRPWSELLDRSALSKPESLSEATLRIRKNYAYFRVNYLAIITVVLGISLITNPFSFVFLAALSAAWMFLYLFRQPSDPPIVILGRQFTDFETLVVLLVLSAIVIFMTSVGSVLVSALLVGVGIVCLHGAFRAPEDLFLDEQEQQSGVVGLLSFFTGGNAAVANFAQPSNVVGNRV